ncbi:MAG: glutamine-hydrolyzing GMP synthase [Candidatus Hodarchaeales archaeon]|jgi:GMP synthase (glutamine-hydrolysing)
MILVIDFGSQVAHLITRKIRELNVYSELLTNSHSIDDILNKNPCGIILSGSPASVNDINAPSLMSDIFDLGIPILGICYGHQLIAKLLGGKISQGIGEYGKTFIFPSEHNGILKGTQKKEIVWMSHSDYVVNEPQEFNITSYSENGYIASMENLERKIFCVQFHPEVHHTPQGKKILDNFLTYADCNRNWSLEEFTEITIENIRKQVGNAKVIMGVSGGVDSTVAAELIHRAIGSNLVCVFVNNGLLRKGEYKEVCNHFTKLDYNFHTIDASGFFLSKLKNVTNPEEKRKKIGKSFIEIFEQKTEKLGEFNFLGQGTIYPDRIESAEPSSQASVIKSHHNVGGLPDKMRLSLVEPLKELYKDEVRAIGKILGIDENLLNRQPFPGPGLAVRIVGAVTTERLKIVQESDHILNEELKKESDYSALWQSFTSFLDIRSVGVMGDARSYQYPIVIRCVQSNDAMTANAALIDIEALKRIASRIVNEVDGVNRVFYDLTDKPPSTIEYE